MTRSPDSRIGTIEVAGGRHSSDGGPTTIGVGAATGAESREVVGVIAEAFLHDPIWSWAFPDPAVRRRWWEVCVHGALRYPWVLRTSGYEAVSVWIPPEGTEFAPEEAALVPEILGELVGSRAPEVLELLTRFDGAHPRHQPHYYLSLLATADAHRGRGLGMALLRENLARIDLAGMPAYLESSNPANNPRYASLGFVPVASFQAPGNGPVVTGMWRACQRQIREVR